MSTKADIIKRLAELGDNDIIAVPAIRTKAEAEDLYEYATSESITLSGEEWLDVVSKYEDAEFFDDEALVSAISEVIGE